MKPSSMKRGHVIRWNGELYKVVAVVHVTPGNKRAHFQTSMKSLSHGRVAQNRFAAHDDIEFINVDSRAMQYLYREGDHHVFMDNENYEQYPLAKEDIEDESQYLTEDLEGVSVLIYNDQPVGLQVPSTVELKVTQCDPGVKGNSATGRNKPATLETGHVVQVPEHIDPDIKVSVDTRSGEFLGRVRN